MNSLKKLTLLAAAALFISISSFASGDVDSTAIGTSDEPSRLFAADWQLYAESAELTIANKDFGAAITWIDKSIEAKATPENLEMKGDLLSSRDMNNSALKYYHRALLLSKEQNPFEDYSRLQAKIWNTRK